MEGLFINLFIIWGLKTNACTNEMKSLKGCFKRQSLPWRAVTQIFLCFRTKAAAYSKSLKYFGKDFRVLNGNELLKYARLLWHSLAGCSTILKLAFQADSKLRFQNIHNKNCRLQYHHWFLVNTVTSICGSKMTMNLIHTPIAVLLALSSIFREEIVAVSNLSILPICGTLMLLIAVSNLPRWIAYMLCRYLRTVLSIKPEDLDSGFAYRKLLLSNPCSLVPPWLSNTFSFFLDF